MVWGGPSEDLGSPGVVGVSQSPFPQGFLPMTVPDLLRGAVFVSAPEPPRHPQ